MSTYKGNNIGLTFDGTGWSYTNLAQDFIDTSTFSTKEPEFPTATQPTTPDEEIPDCPAGYVYDETLKQCVPDPSVQNSYMQEQQNNTTESEKQQAVQIPGTNRFTSDNNFINFIGCIFKECKSTISSTKNQSLYYFLSFDNLISFVFYILRSDTIFVRFEKKAK